MVKIMLKSEILMKINTIIFEKLQISTGPFSKDTTVSDIGMDSIAFMSLIVYLEYELKQKVDLENLLLVGAEITLDDIMNNLKSINQ